MLRRGFGRHVMSLIFALSLLPISVNAQIIVDCTGSDPNALPSINSALSIAAPGTTIVIETGPCNENVYLQGLSNLNLGAWWGQSVAISGGISIQNSENVYLYGLNVSNPTGNGISVASSRGIVLDTCTSSGNSGTGLAVGGQSDVAVNSSGAFAHNGNRGISVSDNSFLNLLAWGGPIDISNNTNAGVYVERSVFSSLGNITITNTVRGTGAGGDGWGVDLRGAARTVWGGVFGPNLIEGNQWGGVSLQENSEVSFWTVSGGFPNVIQSNGPFGVSAGFGSQVTFWDGTQISDHSGPGVDIYANSQAYFYGQNRVFRNGTSTDHLSAGVRVDGNSEVLMRGGEVSLNNGPGVLALVNSSADFTGVTFSGNSDGIIACDSTATMISDLSGPNSTPSAGVRCRSAHSLGNRLVSKTRPVVPDMSLYKAQQARYKRIFTKH